MQPLPTNIVPCLQPTPQERLQEDAIFLSQNQNVKYFNIQNFTTNFLGNAANSKKDETSTLLISRETLNEKENEKSPLFFKISGCVSYCPQLSGCCIFYNRIINEQQMKILYSVNCQSEIYEQACKLYENAIPCYKHLFQYTFSIKDKEKFKLLGLSEDTLLLKVKKELPSRRNKFIYNAAHLQLQMLRYDFIITPNLTQYYIKQFLGGIQTCQTVTNMTNSNQSVFNVNTTTNTATTDNNIDPSVNTNNTTGCLVNRQNTQGTFIMSEQNNSSPTHVNASDFVINHKKPKRSRIVETNVDRVCNEVNNNTTSESDNSDTGAEEEEDEEEDDDTEDSLTDDENSNDNFIEVKNIETENKLNKINKPKLVLKSSLRNLKRKTPSLVSSSNNTESTTKSSNNTTISSVEFCLPIEQRKTEISQHLKKSIIKNNPLKSSNSSTGITDKFYNLKTSSTYAGSSTGVTEKFSKLKASPSVTYAPSSTGITENIDELCIDEIAPLNFDEGPSTSKKSATPSIKSELTDYSDIKEKYPKFIINTEETDYLENIPKYTQYGNCGIYYDVDFLTYFAFNRKPEIVEKLFNTFKDIHGNILKYIKKRGYDRSDVSKINLALVEMRRHPNNRLKQAVYLYLLSDLITIKD